MIVYFSATGNSQFCAEWLADHRKDDLLDTFYYIRHGVSAELQSETPWVFVMPTYCWQMPRIVEDFIQNFRADGTIVVVDPVMGDHGKVYQTYTPAMCAGTAHLAAQADVITPNLTEAALLLGIPYEDLPAGEAGCREIVEKLSLEGRRSVVLTGASLAPGQTGAVCFDARTGQTQVVQTAYIAHEFHGTGDVFSSVLTGALVRGASLAEAAGEAAGFVRACAERTAAEDLPMREGVDFEPLLGLLTSPVPPL